MGRESKTHSEIVKLVKARLRAEGYELQDRKIRLKSGRHITPDVYGERNGEKVIAEVAISTEPLTRAVRQRGLFKISRYIIVTKHVPRFWTRKDMEFWLYKDGKLKPITR